MDRSDCGALDQADPLAGFRNQFELPPDVIYLDGNSLGPLPRGVAARVARTIDQEWGRGLVRSWNTVGWHEAPRRVGAKIAHLLGAHREEVRVTDGTSVNFFKLLAAALRLRPGRRVVLTELESFPTDLYLTQSAVEWLAGSHRVERRPAAELTRALGPDVAVLALGHVDFRTGALRDLPALTAAAHQAGAVVLADVAHSVGALPLRLYRWDVDLAVGCGYKFLNGGPGAPAFVYARRDLLPHLDQPLRGWFGHARPFAFEPDYVPAEGVDRLLCGTPPILSLVALEEALELWTEVDLHDVRRKSLALSELLIAEVMGRCSRFGVELASPEDPEQRGSHVAFRHPRAFELIQALAARHILGDFRPPDLLRLGLAPLYLRYVDVFDTACALDDLLVTGAHENPLYQQRRAVT